MSAWSLAEVAGRAIGDVDPPHARLGDAMECRRCVCGGYVWANPDNPGPSVAAHQATPGHRRWWQREEERP